MARTTDDISFLQNLTSTALFKRNQGRMVRRLTAIALSAVALLGCWTLSNTVLSESDPGVRRGIPAVLAVAALWAVFRLINFPRFTNFLISVEAEMDKVSWADQQYLKRATAVVLGVMVFLGTLLWVYDFLLFRLASLSGIIDAEALNSGGQ